MGNPGLTGFGVAFIALLLIRLGAMGPKQRKKRTATLAAQKTFIQPTHPYIDGANSPHAVTAEQQINAIRQLMGPPPRTFDPLLATYLKLNPPDWLERAPKDEIWVNVRDQQRIRRSGLIVWATYVQANTNLFKPGPIDSPASVIYSPDPWFDRNRETLRQIAHRCYLLKNTEPTEIEQAVLARMLTVEISRGMGMRVPRSFTGSRPVFHSSLLFSRKHLPKGFLSGRYFPVWMDVPSLSASLLVPAAYWPASLRAEWER